MKWLRLWGRVEGCVEGIRSHEASSDSGNNQWWCISCLALASGEPGS